MQTLPFILFSLITIGALLLFFAGLFQTNIFDKNWSSIKDSNASYDFNHRYKIRAWGYAAALLILLPYGRVSQYISIHVQENSIRYISFHLAAFAICAVLYWGAYSYMGKFSSTKEGGIRKITPSKEKDGVFHKKLSLIEMVIYLAIGLAVAMALAVFLFG